jgi:hypothetical protein
MQVLCGKEYILVTIDETAVASGSEDANIVIGVFRNGRHGSHLLCHARKCLQ